MSKFFEWRPLLFILISGLLIIAIGIFSTYRWQQNKIKLLNNKISLQDVKINSLNDQVALLSSELTKACQSSQAGLPLINHSCSGYSYLSEKGVRIFVYLPQKDSLVHSPVYVLGEVPGDWSFEAQFPVRLLNQQGAVVSQAPARVLGEWTTSSLVPFYAELTFNSSQIGSGELVLQKDNPSGLKQNDDKLTIPIQF